MVELDPDDDLTVTLAEFKTACAEADGNAVVLDHSLKIISGGVPQQHFPFGCTLILGPNVKLELDRLAITFDGLLVIQSSRNAELMLKQCLLVRGGSKFLAEFQDTGLYAPANIQLEMAGSEGVLKASGSLFASSQGSLTVPGLSTKSRVEMNDCGLRFQGAGTIRLQGADGTIKLNQLEIGSFHSTATTGGVTVEAGTGTAARGAVELSEIAIANVASITVRGSKSGSSGLVKAEKSVLSATGNVLVESGIRGTTEVKESHLTSGTLIRITTGSSGSCSSGSNNLSAPSVQACP